MLRLSSRRHVIDKVAQAREAIQDSRVLDLLQDYSPRVVSTIFVGLDTRDSDVDIVCCYESQDKFVETFSVAFETHEDFSLKVYPGHVVGRFWACGFEIEVYSCAEAVHSQNAYRHYRVMERLVELGGDEFMDRIRALKRAGLKTEPAIARALGLAGDPYEAVLRLEGRSRSELQDCLANSR